MLGFNFVVSVFCVAKSSLVLERTLTGFINVTLLPVCVSFGPEKNSNSLYCYGSTLLFSIGLSPELIMLMSSAYSGLAASLTLLLVHLWLKTCKPQVAPLCSLQWSSGLQLMGLTELSVCERFELCLWELSFSLSNSSPPLTDSRYLIPVLTVRFTKPRPKQTVNTGMGYGVVTLSWWNHWLK